MWEYTGSDAKPLYSKRSGGAEFLSNGNLMVADGRAGEPIREYGIISGNFRSDYGDTGTAVMQSVDLAFAPDGSVYIADLAGDVVTCLSNGTACASLGGAAAALAVGGPSGIAVNPAANETMAQIVVADSVNAQVISRPKIEK